MVATPHYHGTSDNDLRDRLLSLYAPLGRWALRRASAVIAVSEWERRQLGQDFGVEARVIHNGLDVNGFRTATPEPRERPYLLTVVGPWSTSESDTLLMRSPIRVLWSSI